MIRNDGSVKSANAPIWDNRSRTLEYGIFKAMVTEVYYTDNTEDNDSVGENKPNEVVYKVKIIGGRRDGQIFPNARMLKKYGGLFAYEETVLHGVKGLSGLDPTQIPLSLADPSLHPLTNRNGDVVYIQFLNGDTTMPLIMGMAKHTGNSEKEASESEGLRVRKKINGIFTEINKDGEFSWTKDNGLYLPFFIDPETPTKPYVNQFAPLIGQKDAVKITLGNQYNFKFEYSLGLNVSIDGIADEFAFTTTAGAFYKLNGISDTFEAGTTVGTNFKIDGINDAIIAGTAVGTNLKIDGINDSFSVATAAGDALTLSSSSGLEVKTVSGSSFNLSADGSIKATSASKAAIELDPAGFIKIGNSSGDVLKDVLQELIKALTTEAPAGYGAPLVNTATYVQLLTKMSLFTGG